MSTLPHPWKNFFGRPCLQVTWIKQHLSYIFRRNIFRRSVNFVRSRFTRAQPSETELPYAMKYILKHNSYRTESFLKQWICTDHWLWSVIQRSVSISSIISNERQIVQQLMLIWMSPVSRGLTGVIIALWRRLRYSTMEKLPWELLILLLRNERYRATIMPARMKANGNFSDANVERFYSVRINRMMTSSDTVDLARPCDSLVEFQVVHRYVFKVV